MDILKYFDKIHFLKKLNFKFYTSNRYDICCQESEHSDQKLPKHAKIWQIPAIITKYWQLPGEKSPTFGQRTTSKIKTGRTSSPTQNDFQYKSATMA